MTTIVQRHKPHALWTWIRTTFARANAVRRERAMAQWCGDDPPAGRWRADRMYRLVQRAYSASDEG